MSSSHDMEDPPPAYDADAPGNHDVDAQRALAPLKVDQKNGNIKQDYTVFCDGFQGDEAVYLKSTNGAIQTHLSLLGLPAGPDLGIIAASVNGGIDLSVTNQEKSTLRIDCSTRNGACRLRLPLQFSGSLLCFCVNGRITLSDNLRQSSVQAPLELGDSGKATRWHINGGGPSHCSVKSTNGMVDVDFVS